MILNAILSIQASRKLLKLVAVLINSIVSMVLLRNNENVTGKVEVFIKSQPIFL